MPGRPLPVRRERCARRGDAGAMRAVAAAVLEMVVEVVVEVVVVVVMAVVEIVMAMSMHRLVCCVPCWDRSRKVSRMVVTDNGYLGEDI